MTTRQPLIFPRYFFTCGISTENALGTTNIIFSKSENPFCDFSLKNKNSLLVCSTIPESSRWMPVDLNSSYIPSIRQWEFNEVLRSFATFSVPWPVIHLVFSVTDGFILTHYFPNILKYVNIFSIQDIGYI